MQLVYELLQQIAIVLCPFLSCQGEFISLSSGLMVGFSGARHPVPRDSVQFPMCALCYLPGGPMCGSSQGTGVQSVQEVFSLNSATRIQRLLRGRS